MGNVAITLADIRRAKQARWSDAEIRNAFESRSRCTLCPHFVNDPDTGVVMVRSNGPDDPKMLVIGESPGHHESQQDRAFIGPAANHFRELLGRAKVDVDAVRFTNFVRCFSHEPDLKPKPPEFRDAVACAPYLYDELERTNPMVIMTVGDFPTKCMLGDVPTITRTSGKLFNVEIRGKRYAVVPCVHPSADLRSGGRFANAIISAAVTAWGMVNRREVPVVSHVINNTDDAIDYLKGLLAAYKSGEIKLIGYDLEWGAIMSDKKSRSESDRSSVRDLYNPEVKLVAASFATNKREGTTIILDHVESKTDFDRIKPWMARVVSTIPCVVHGYSKAEGPWSRERLGCQVNLRDDTMLMSYAVYAQTRSHGLKPQSALDLEWADWSVESDAWFNAQPADKRSFKYLPLEIMARYASIDPCATLALRQIYRKKILELGVSRNYRRRLAVCRVFVKWEERGGVVDLEKLKETEFAYRQEVDRLAKRLSKYREVRRYVKRQGKPFNPGSGQQVADVMYGYFGAAIGRTNPKLKRDVDIAVTIRTDVPAGTDLLPIMADMKPAKNIWIGRIMGDRRGERAAIAEATQRGLKLKKPLKRNHKAPVTVLRGTPAVDEKEMFRILRRAACPGCKGKKEIDNAKCQVCGGTGVREGMDDLNQFVRDLRMYGKIRTCLQNYLSSKNGIPAHLMKGDRMTYEHLLHVVATGRISVKNMNIHAFPYESDIRRLLVSAWREEGGLILATDYSQLEVRALASISGDETLRRAYLLCEKCGKTWGMESRGVCPKCDVRLGTDLHRVTARVLFKIPDNEPVPDLQRSMAKCFHPDTEVLTRSGWKKITQLRRGEEVIQAIPGVSGEPVRFEWAVPTEVFTQVNESGHLIHLKNCGMDVRVTPDHRMLGWGRSKRGNFTVVMPDKAGGLRYWANAGCLEGSEAYPERLLRLAVAVQADGSVHGLRVRFGFSKKRKIVRLRSLLEDGEYTMATHSNGRHGKTITFTLNRELSATLLGMLDEKRLPWHWLRLSLQCRKIVVDEARHWDSTTDSRLESRRYAYSSAIKQNVDVLQAIASSCGHKSNLMPAGAGWRLSIGTHARSRGGNLTSEKVHFTGKVACLSVPSTFVLVRDGGIPVVTGQSTVFGLIYGRGAQGIAEETGISVSEAQGVIDSFFDQFPGVRDYVQTMHAVCVEKGEHLSASGTLLHFTGWDSNDEMRRAEAKRAAQNYPIQGPAGELTLDAIIRLDKAFDELEMSSVMWETTHDSLSFDVYPGELFEVSRVARQVMEQDVLEEHTWVDVPVLTDQAVGVRWDGAVKIDAIDGDQMKVSGPGEFYEELLDSLRKTYTVRAKVHETKMGKPKDEVFSTKGYAGGSGRLDHVEATIRLS